MTDAVESPAHYNQGPIECIDGLRSALTPEEFRGLCKASAIQYIWRERHKGGDESIRKAIWYLKELLGENRRDYLVKVCADCGEFKSPDHAHVGNADIVVEEHVIPGCRTCEE